MQKRFVSIWFPYLATDWFALRKPELKNLAFVLVSPSRGRMLIAAASPLAQKNGIHPGGVLADARAIHPALKYFDDKPALSSQLLQRIAEWCIRFTPSAAVDPLGGIILDASGCSHLWGSDEAYVTDIMARLKAKGYTAKAAMADTIGAAWAVSRYTNKTVVEEGGQMAALLSLPPQALRIESATVQRLHKLGLKQIKDFISFPAPSLRRRFGPLIIQRLHQAIGTEEEFINPIYPIEPYAERLPCLEPITPRTGIEIALEKLLQNLCARLVKEGKGLRSAYFRGYRVDGGATGIEIRTSRASANAIHLLNLFALKLDAIEPGLGIELFVVEATKVEEAAPVQEQFWKAAASFNNIQLSELLDRLIGKLGAGVINRYLPVEQYWPERSFKKTASITEGPTTVWKLDKPRPLRMLSPPERIEVTAPIPDYPPMNFRYRGALYIIKKADGPERIEQEWWIEEGKHRDYYAVEDEKGCRYWLFRSGHYHEDNKPEWFLHGFFA